MLVACQPPLGFPYSHSSLGCWSSNSQQCYSTLLSGQVTRVLQVGDGIKSAPQGFCTCFRTCPCPDRISNQYAGRMRLSPPQFFHTYTCPCRTSNQCTGRVGLSLPQCFHTYFCTCPCLCWTSNEYAERVVLLPKRYFSFFFLACFPNECISRSSVTEWFAGYVRETYHIWDVQLGALPTFTCSQILNDFVTQGLGSWWTTDVGPFILLNHCAHSTPSLHTAPLLCAKKPLSRDACHRGSCACHDLHICTYCINFNAFLSFLSQFILPSFHNSWCVIMFLCHLFSSFIHNQHLQTTHQLCLEWACTSCYGTMGQAGFMIRPIISGGALLGGQIPLHHLLRL